MRERLPQWLVGILLCMYGASAWALNQTGGVYQIGTAQDLADFAALVNGGGNTACAVITADIDYTGQQATIGTDKCNFYGTLDGQGHTVTVDMVASQDGCALVRYAAGAIRNLHVTGSIKSAFKHAAGVAAYTYGALIENCVSSVSIQSTVDGDATCAGIVGLSQQSTTLKGCVSRVTISGDKAANCGGLVGWASGYTTIQNCMYVGEMDIVMNSSSAVMCRGSASNILVDSCYALTGFGGTVNAGTTLVEQSQIESGEVAYRLGMSQKIGTDAVPTPWGGDRVYATTEECDGTGAKDFTNVKAEAHQAEHIWDGYRCSVCGAVDGQFVTPHDGVYSVSTPQQLAWVAEMVNQGSTTMDVRLTADIDMAGYDEWPMIGSVKYPYRGHFDGQHHVISNLLVSRPTATGVGLFGTISSPAVLENLTLDAQCSILGRAHVGIIGHSQGAGYISLHGLGNQGSVAAVPTADGGHTDAGVGGIIGNSPHGCHGEISDCWFAGQIPSGTSCAFISGWVGTDQFSMKGCWSIAEGNSNIGEATCLARAGRSGTAIAMSDCASVYGTQATKITDAQVASGELCYIVNGGSSDNPTWHQTLGTDAMPTLTGTCIVYAVGTKNCDGTTADGFGFSNENSGFVQKPHSMDHTTGLCSVCGNPDTSADGFCLIPTAQALRWVADQVNTGSRTRVNLRLTADIDLAGDNWTPIGNDQHPYAGELDGAQHRISNMTVDTEDVGGLIGTMTEGSVHDLLIDATCSVKGARYTGGLIGHTTGSYTVAITNVGTMCPVTCAGSGSNAAAGIIGNANAGNVTNITRCFSTGFITSAGDVACISAWQGNVGSKVTDCWTVSQISEHTSYNFCRGGSKTTISNCYCAGEYTGGLKANYIGTINADMLASGELCYTVNGNSSENPVWYQTLQADEAPLPWDSHRVVYAVGALRCDGTSAGGELTYSNENTSVVPPHNYEDGICSECGTLNQDYKQPVGGFYQLATAGDVAWFSRMVNSVKNDINACLTADVDMAEANDKFEQIGLKVGFAGVFDGQDHRVSNLNVDVDNDDAGFISASLSGMVLRNITFDASCSIKTSSNYAGLVGASNWGQTGTTTIQNVGMEGSVTVGGVNAGGLLGGNHDSKGIIAISQCYVTGTVAGLGRGESAAFAGWIGTSASSYIRNCWTTAEVTGQDGAKEAYRGTAAVSNCYSLTGGQFKQFDAAEVATGELAWKLNGGSFVSPVWYQTIGDDEQPTWMAHGLVYANGEGEYDDVHDQASYEVFRDYIIASETEQMNELVADKALETDYIATLAGMSELPTLKDFTKAYAAAQAQRDAISTSKALYEAYDAQAKYAIEYIKANTFECDEAERLSEYLTTNAEPGGNFANGTYIYIMQTHLLNDEAIAAETDFVKNLLAAAIAADYQPGADITDLMANASLDAGRDGWDIQCASNTYPRILSVEGVMSAAETWNCNFTMTQTVNGLKPGVYMLRSNAAFRPGADGYSKFHAAQVMLGRNVNYAMTEIEDALSKDLAVDGENCHVTGSAPDYTIVTDDGEALIPQGPIGCAYAFKGQRYQNYVAVQIEEGDSLVIGVRNQGTGMQRDWVGFGNFHLMYLGSAAEATTQLATVLDNYLARARAIADFQWSDNVDFAQYPNYSEALKTELDAAIANAAQATDGAGMMQAIDRLSDLFQQIYECRVAYIAMARAAETLSALATTFQHQGVFAADAPELEYMNGVSDQLWTYYSLGTPDAEDALRMSKDIYSLSVFPNMNDGCYQLASVTDLKMFSAMVNSGMSSIKAQLTADLDMSGEDNFVPIGFNTESNNASAAAADQVTFNGVFDGQGHHISNLTVRYENGVGIGLFGTLTAPAEVRNLVLDANCAIKGYDRVGLIGRSTNGGMVTLERLGNEGTVEAVYQAAAGIMGNANNGSVAAITDCYSTGSIQAGNGKNAAQICGWLGSVGAVLTNCWSVSDISGYDAENKLFCRFGSNTMIVNSFSTSGDGSQARLVTNDDFASGSITWQLNSGNTEAPVWHQTLGADLHPVFVASHSIVVKNSDGTYSNITGDAVQGVAATLGGEVSVYDIQGRLVRAGVQASQALQALPQGMYILRGASASRKVMVK